MVLTFSVALFKEDKIVFNQKNKIKNKEKKTMNRLNKLWSTQRNPGGRQTS